MQTFSPSPVPNQVFPVRAGGRNYRLSLRYFRGLAYASLSEAYGEVLSGSVRCADRAWILPWGELPGGGNIRFEDGEGKYPSYARFGTKCFLVYYSADEIAELAGGRTNGVV